jgi:metal-dependent amidase/aminoacylase/carboxypeptidase family protein
VLVGQPSEERLDGAKAMLGDHLYDRFGTPNWAIALHDTETRAAGAVSLNSGPATASATSVDVTIRGIGGHGAFPQLSKDRLLCQRSLLLSFKQSSAARQIQEIPLY